MQVQIFKPTAGTLRDFQVSSECLESALETNNKSNKTSKKEKINKKRCCNNNNNKGSQKHYCMLHQHNPVHSTDQCRTLKKEAEKVKKVAKMATAKMKSVIIIQARKRFMRLHNLLKNNAAQRYVES